MPLDLRELILPELRAETAIPSGFRTNSIYRLTRDDRTDSLEWTLHPHQLPNPLIKNYDNGEVNEILAAYGEHVDPHSLHFLGAFNERDMQGLAVWREEGWNATLWLLDIRVREKSRGQGIGSRLLQHLKELVVDRQLRGMLVETQSNNTPAIDFYRRHGFRISGFNDHLYTNSDVDRDDVAMYLFWEAGT